MEIKQIILLGVFIGMIAVGIVWVYDARQIAKKRFSTNEQNKVAFAMKILGALISIGGALGVMWQIP